MYNPPQVYELNYEPRPDFDPNVLNGFRANDHVGERKVNRNAVAKRRAKNKAARRARRGNR